MDHAADRAQGAREYQQDEYGVIDGTDLMLRGLPLKVFIIADGMGGHQSGERASELAAYHFVTSFENTKGALTDRLRASLDAANESIRMAVEEEPDLAGMGTTLVAAAVTEESVEWVSVGDSRLRHFVVEDETLHQLNADHSMTPVIDAMADAGNDVSHMEGDQNTLRSALVGRDIPMVDLSSQPRALAEGDVLLLASDGLDSLGEDKIRDLIKSSRKEGASRIVEALLDKVRSIGRSDQDNVTAIAVVVGAASETFKEIGESKRIETDSFLPLGWFSQKPRGLSLGLLALAVVLAAYFMWSGKNVDDSARPASELEEVVEPSSKIGTEPGVEPSAEVPNEENLVETEPDSESETALEAEGQESKNPTPEGEQNK